MLPSSGPNVNSWSHSIAEIRCTNLIHNCCGYLSDIGDGSFLAVQTAHNLSPFGYGFFRCILSENNSNSDRAIALQIYLNRRHCGKLMLLFLNEHFANGNGFKHGDKVILIPTRTSRCNSVELHPTFAEDWHAFVAQSSLIEEQFLGQIRLVSSGMSFILKLDNSEGKDKQKIVRFHVNVPAPSSNEQLAFLLDMDTHVIVMPGNYNDEETTTSENVAQNPTDVHGIGNELDEHKLIEGFLWPRVKPCSFRVLPNAIFDKSKYPMLAQIDHLPLIFVLLDNNDCPDEELTKPIKQFLVKIQCQKQQQLPPLGAILCQIDPKISGNSDEEDQRLISDLVDIFKRANHIGISHCWLTRGIRRTMKSNGIDAHDLSWIRISPIRVEQTRMIGHVLCQTSSPIVESRNALKTLFSQTNKWCPFWPIPNGGFPLQIGTGEGKLIAKLVAKEPKPLASNSIQFFWPLSMQLQIKFEENCAGLKKEDDSDADEVDAMGLTQIGLEIPAQQEILQKLSILLASRIKYTLLFDQNPSDRLGHILLVGPIGSGKTTILTKLAQQLRTILDNAGPLMASEFLDFAEISPSAALSQLKAKLERLNDCWPSTLFIDNFDAFFDKIMGGQQDESASRIRLNKIYQNIFTAFDFCKRRIPVIASVKDDHPKFMNEINAFNGGKFFTETHQIEEFSQQNQLEILTNAIHGIWPTVELDGNFGQLNFTTIGSMLRLIGRMELYRGEEIDFPKLQTIIAETAKLGQNTGINEGELRRISFNQIAGLSDAKQRLIEIFIWPSKYAKLFTQSSVQISKRAILYGPSGCGKSLLIMALADQMGISVFSVKGPELFSKYIGQSEQKVRQLFARARNSRPSLIVFDEFDALAPQRGSDNAHVTDRLVNQLLTELDGFDEDLNDVFIVAATNRLDLIDKALLRPGRIEHKIYVGKPNLEERVALLRLYSEDANSGGGAIPLSNNVNLKLIAEQTEGQSSAEVRALVQNALWEAEREGIGNLCQRHFQQSVNGRTKGDERRANENWQSSGEIGRQKLALE